jgi:hypothetical protein
LGVAGCHRQLYLRLGRKRGQRGDQLADRGDLCSTTSARPRVGLPSRAACVVDSATLPWRPRATPRRGNPGAPAEVGRISPPERARYP